jgi:hypothetical protein
MQAMRRSNGVKFSRLYRGFGNGQRGERSVAPFWSESEALAAQYGQVGAGSGSFKNALEIDAAGGPWFDVPIPAALRREFRGLQTTDTEALAAAAKRRGYDGLVIRNVMDDDTGVVLEPTTVVADLSGRILPVRG